MFVMQEKIGKQEKPSKTCEDSAFQEKNKEIENQGISMHNLQQQLYFEVQSR